MRFQGPELWKNLLQDMKKCYSEGVFKTKVKKYKGHIAEIKYGKGRLLTKTRIESLAIVKHGQLMKFIF